VHVNGGTTGADAVLLVRAVDAGSDGTLRTR
jgi:hypothetical protein